MNRVLHSGSLGRNMRYRVLLPSGYRAGNRRFPVLYLLHGVFGDYLNWVTRTSLATYAQDYPLVIVMPDADDSWYTNAAKPASHRFEDYVARDLVAAMDEQYRTMPTRQGRAIAGLSMGGYGALKIALKHPRSFAFAGSLSGALDAARDLDRRAPELREKLLEVFGRRASRTRRENDLFQLVKIPRQKRLPYFYLACGTKDDFLRVNREFAAELSSRKIAFEYHETPGRHAWEYWGQAVRPMLSALRKTLASH